MCTSVAEEFDFMMAAYVFLCDHHNLRDGTKIIIVHMLNWSSS